MCVGVGLKEGLAFWCSCRVSSRCVCPCGQFRGSRTPTPSPSLPEFSPGRQAAVSSTTPPRSGPQPPGNVCTGGGHGAIFSALKAVFHKTRHKLYRVKTTTSRRLVGARVPKNCNCYLAGAEDRVGFWAENISRLLAHPNHFPRGTTNRNKKKFSPWAVGCDNAVNMCDGHHHQL